MGCETLSCPGIWNCSIPAYEDDRAVGGDGHIHDVARTVAAPGAFGVVAELQQTASGTVGSIQAAQSAGRRTTARRLWYGTTSGPSSVVSMVKLGG